eukprot:3091721-Pyramimonas_sp.AAC.1
MAGKTATLSAERSVFAWIPAWPNDKRPAHGNKAREIKARKLAHRWMSYHVYNRCSPAGQYAICPPWKWWAYLTQRIDKTDYGTDVGILNILTGTQRTLMPG